MSSIPEARIATIALGFTDNAQIPYGFGYLAPESENRFALGTLFSSHMFPGRAPGGHVLLEALVGGRRHPERLELDDEAMIEKVYEDLSQLLVLPEKPNRCALANSSVSAPFGQTRIYSLLLRANTRRRSVLPSGFTLANLFGF